MQGQASDRGPLEQVSLVTGGAGFIGSHIAAALLTRGHRVICLDNLAGGRRENVPEGAEFVEGDVCDETLLNKLFARNQFHQIFHLAAFAAEGFSHFVRKFTFANNVGGAASVINAALNREPKPLIIFASSVAVYGKNDAILDENMPPSPVDPYGISKAASELDLRAASDFFQLPHTIFRLHNVFGERQNLDDRYRNVVGIFLRQLLDNHPLTINGDGSQSRQFTPVSLVAKVMVDALDEPRAKNKTFNLGSNDSHRVIDIAKHLCAVAGRPFCPEFLPARNEAPHPLCSHDKVRSLFPAARTDISFMQEMHTMHRWACEQSSRPMPRNPTAEVLELLPERWC